jgi:uncharacterized membrane protein
MNHGRDKDKVTTTTNTNNNNNNNNKQRTRDSYGKKILEEDEYITALSNIIEKDYFPVLFESRRHNEQNDQNSERFNHYTVDQFTQLIFREFTSYDNSSYDILQEKDLAEHRKRYHWVYDHQEPSIGLLKERNNTHNSSSSSHSSSSIMDTQKAGMFSHIIKEIKY